MGANAELGRAIRHHPLMVLETRARFVLPKLMAQQALNPPKNVGGVRRGGLGLCLGAFTLKKGARRKQWDGAAGCLRARAARGVSPLLARSAYLFLPPSL